MSPFSLYIDRDERWHKGYQWRDKLNISRGYDTDDHYVTWQITMCGYTQFKVSYTICQKFKNPKCPDQSKCKNESKQTRLKRSQSKYPGCERLIGPGAPRYQLRYSKCGHGISDTAFDNSTEFCDSCIQKYTALLMPCPICEHENQQSKKILNLS